MSEVLIPISLFVMVLGIIVVVNYEHYKIRTLRSRERLAAIEKGLLLPEGDFLADVSDPRKTAARTRLTAIILIAAGIGTASAFVILAWVLRERDVLSAAAFAIIPLAIGIGMLFDYRLQSRALEEAKSEENLKRLPA